MKWSKLFNHIARYNKNITKHIITCEETVALLKFISKPYVYLQTKLEITIVMQISLLFRRREKRRFKKTTIKEKTCSLDKLF
jgi:hypothetical protein